MSGTLLQMSRRPSPEKSTAKSTKFDGMNWVWPMAPAHELTIFSRGRRSSCMIFMATISSLRKYGCR